MNRNAIAKSIRRHGDTYFVLSRQTPGDLLPAECFLKPSNLQLWCSDRQLAAGDLMHPIGKPDRLFLVTERRDLRLYEEYEVRRISHRAQLLRFGTDDTRDTFGRPTTSTPSMVYSDLPVYLLPATSDSNQNTPDRSTTATSYNFLTSDRFQVQPKDRLTVGNQNLVVDSIQLSASGLLQFTATSTV